MFETVELPLWLLVVILAFAAVTFASHFLFPPVRWFFRRRLENAVERLNQRLERPIEPFRLLRRQDMVQRLIYDPEVTQAIVDHAREEGVREDVAFHLARRYAREIVPGFSAFAYFGFAIRAARMLSRALYRVRLTHADENALAKIDAKSTVVFVMNHRSNMDYVLVTYLAAERSALAYAVGEWARVWPLSRLIRAMGAYFIRRKSRNALYRRVLARYVRMATDGGVTQAMFPEGGLSLDGALSDPKLGLLKYITDGAEPSEHDIVFVPVALNYDRVLEDRVLIRAGETGNRRFPARIGVVMGFVLKQIWMRLRGRYQRFGYAAVSFGEPLSLHSLSDQPDDATTEELATELMRRIANEIPILPVPLIAQIMLNSDTPMTRDALTRAMADLITRLPKDNIQIPEDDPTKAVKFALDVLSARRILEIGETQVAIAPDQAPALQFYANSIAHFLNSATAK